MNIDNYSDIAEKYDYMLSDDPNRRTFFEKSLKNHGTKTLLDCSCGTGSDLLMFKSIVDNVTGSDLSDSMLKVARERIEKADLNIKIRKADFRYLNAVDVIRYDAVVCLSSSICEIHSDDDVIITLQSMFDSLNNDGLLIIDQGQSDAMMKSRPRFIPVINDRDLSRLFVIDYLNNSNEFITVNICDLEHTEEKCSFSLNPFKLRVRLIDEWKDLLQRADIRSYKFYGNWDMSDYDKSESKRIIITALKNI